MIVTVAVVSAIAATLAGIRVLVKRRGPEARRSREAPVDDSTPRLPEVAPAAVAEGRVPDGFAAAVGDVFMSRYGDDLLLVGAVVFAEGSPWAAIFVTSDAAGKAVFVRANGEAALLTSVPDPSGALGRDIPSTLEWSGHAYMRERRIPLNASTVGEGTPKLATSVVVHELDGEGGRIAFAVASAGDRFLWVGTKLRPDEFEIVAPK